MKIISAKKNKDGSILITTDQGEWSCSGEGSAIWNEYEAWVLQGNAAEPYEARTNELLEATE